MKKYKWWLVGAAGVAAVWAWSAGGNGSAERIVYSTVEIGKGEIVRSVTASGQVSALITVEVGSQLSGQVQELHADFNTEVTAGQLIALIDPQTYEARVRQASAEIEVSHANLAIQKAALIAERASVREAQGDFERKRALAEKGHVSQADLDSARAGLETAQARVLMAEAQVVNARAEIKQRDASLFQANIDLRRTQIRAPVDGVVIERNVDVGQTVAASLSSPVLFLIAKDLRNMQVEANIDEADIGNVVEGNSVTFTVDAYPDREFTGTVAQIRKAPVLSENVVTYMAVISTRNDDLKLLPGMTASVNIVTGHRSDVLRVDNAALRFRPKGASTQAPGASGGGGRQFVGGMIEQLTRTLNLSARQQSDLSDAIASQMRAAQAAASGGSDGADRQALFAQMRSRMERILADILTPAQLELYRQSNQHRPGRGRAGQLWVEDGDDGLVRKNVRLGISDDNFTEILGGDLKAGDQVVARAKRVGGNAPGTR